jgi:threonine dehydratase
VSEPTADAPTAGSPPTVDAPTVDLARIRSAAHLLDGVILRTPIQGSRWLSDLVGGPVVLKCENLQRAGSFKIRGAYTRIAALSADERARGVVAASAGNHAQGVALAARMLGAPATVFMPHGASLAKENATRAYGADVRLAGATIDEALVTALAFAEETGASLVHPFDHPDIVAGQGTVGLEILEQVPDVATIVVCTGGGGLLAGIATAVKALRPDVRVLGAQAAGAAAWPASLAAGHPVALGSMSTMADGIAVGRPGQVPFDLVRRHVDGFLTVSEEALSRALVMLLERAKLVVEPAGAAAVAAIADHAVTAQLQAPVVAVVSGGNVDPLLLLRIVRHGLVAAGRYLSVQVSVPDRPGALAGVLTELAGADVNVLEVSHVRTSAALAIDEVAIAFSLETRGPDHSAIALEALRARGWRVVAISE